MNDNTLIKTNNSTESLILKSNISKVDNTTLFLNELKDLQEQHALTVILQLAQ